MIAEVSTPTTTGPEDARRAAGGPVVAAPPAGLVQSEVSEKAERRRFTAEYKAKILREAERCKSPGQVGALLRREGLYSSLSERVAAPAGPGRESGFEGDPSRTEAPCRRPSHPPARARECPARTAPGTSRGDHRYPKKSLRTPGDPPGADRLRRDRLMTRRRGASTFDRQSARLSGAPPLASHFAPTHEAELR